MSDATNEALLAKLEQMAAAWTADLDRLREEFASGLDAVRGELETLRAALGIEPDTREPVQREQAAERLASLRSDLEAIQRTREAAPEPDQRWRERGAPYGDDVDFETVDFEGRRMRLGEILFEAGIISQEQLEDALRAQENRPHHKLGQILVDKGYTGEDVIARVLASQLDMPFVNFADDPPREEAVHLLTRKVAAIHKVMPVRVRGNDTLVVAMANPLDLIAVDDVEHATNMRVEVAVATTSAIEAALAEHYGVPPGMTT
jgi:hypothetical protein